MRKTSKVEDTAVKTEKKIAKGKTTRTKKTVADTVSEATEVKPKKTVTKRAVVKKVKNAEVIAESTSVENNVS